MATGSFSVSASATFRWSRACAAIATTNRWRRWAPISMASTSAHRRAVPYSVTPKHTAEAAAILGPSKWLAVEQKVTLETDPAKARALGRKELSRYMVLPNYRNSWLRQGFTEAELADGGSDRFIDAMVLWGR